MSRRVVYSPVAVTDLEEIGDFIARDNPRRAQRFVAELMQKCRLVAASPRTYELRDDLAPDLRIAVHHRYIIAFREIPDEQAVRIERILHGARHLPGLLGDD